MVEAADLVPAAPAAITNRPTAGDTDTTVRSSRTNFQLARKQVMRLDIENYESIYTHCRRILGDVTWGRVLAALGKQTEPRAFPDDLTSLRLPDELPGFLPDLARLEWHCTVMAGSDKPPPRRHETLAINPHFTLIPVSWKNLTFMITADGESPAPPPKPEKGFVMIWRHPETDAMKIREAENIDLLVLKIAVEKIDPCEAAAMGDVHVRAIDSAINRAVDRGILLQPPSRIERTPGSSLTADDPLEPYLSVKAFTLQWHITQECDLHCRHCYDRSDRNRLSDEAAIEVLDDFHAFCRQMHVKGQVTFTGGNPMLHPRFIDIYQAAWDRGFGVGILGNPTPLKKVEELLSIARPLFFQISIEGLVEYNDYIRGSGHFARSLAFLQDLKGLDIRTMVMLTLTRDNIDQVLPLASMLEDRTNYFTFNRLAAVGEGANLAMPSREDFEVFLRRYEAEAGGSRVLGLKDNLINILREESGETPFGGCTGYGCGAAFNFVALLPDGEVHACRKFPSLIGNIRRMSLLDIYSSDTARRYREGSEACRECSLFAVCRGCMAVTYSKGLDIFNSKDPFCFKAD